MNIWNNFESELQLFESATSFDWVILEGILGKTPSVIFPIHISSFQGGPGLAFLAYPEVVSKLPSASVWAVLFFVMLISLALGSIFGAFETVITACEDQWPILRGTFQDFLIELDMKPRIHLVEISIFLLNNVTVRRTKIMNRADKIGHIFRK